MLRMETKCGTCNPKSGRILFKLELVHARGVIGWSLKLPRGFDQQHSGQASMMNGIELLGAIEIPGPEVSFSKPGTLSGEISPIEPSP